MGEGAKTLEIRTSPHILSGYSVDTIMFNVVLALLPVTAFAVYAFGTAALLTLLVAVASCLATESDLFFRCMAQPKFPYPILMFPVSDMDVRRNAAQRAWSPGKSG